MNVIMGMIEDNRDGFIIICLFTVGLGFLLFALTPGPPVILGGEVVDKMYQGSTRTSGMGVGGDGKLIVMSGGNPEAWKLILKENGRINSYSVSADIYYKVQVGEVVTLECGTRLGLVTCADGVVK
jgi:hypothetical protein